MKRILLLLALFPTITYGMEKSLSKDQLQHELVRKICSNDISGIPEVHRNLRALLEYTEAITKDTQFCNNTFIKKLIRESFLQCPIEILVISQHLNYSKDIQNTENKDFFKKMCAQYEYTSNFFSQDAQEIESFDNAISSHLFCEKLSKMDEILDAYSEWRTKSEKTQNDVVKLRNIIRSNANNLMAEYGIAFPQNSEPNFLKNFLDLNERNPSVHDENNFHKVLKLLRARIVLNYGIDYLGSSLDDFKKELSDETTRLKNPTAELTKINCNIC